MPRPLDGHGPRVQNNEGLVPMYGFIFTRNGLFHDLTSSDLEAYTQAITAPEDHSNPHYADGDASD